MLNFSDPNAAQRRKERVAEGLRRWKFADAVAKYHNKGTSLKINKNTNTIGFSRAQSDIYASALNTQGNAWKTKEQAFTQQLLRDTYEGEGSSNRAGRNQALALLSKQAQLEKMVTDGFGRNTAIANQASLRNFHSKQALAIEKRGLPPQYGPPAFLTPRNTLGQIGNIVSSVASVASMASGLGAFGKLSAEAGGGKAGFFDLFGGGKNIIQGTGILGIGTAPKQ